MVSGIALVIQKADIAMSFDLILQILGYGLSGLVFLLAFLAYRIISKEQDQESPRDSVIRSATTYMQFCFALGVLSALSSWLASGDRPTDEVQALHDDHLAAWSSWYRNISEAVSGASDPADALLAALADNPRPQRTFYGDMLAGSFLLRIGPVQQLFQRRLGVYADSFVGTGLSVPWDSSYSEMQIPEYLAPNTSERNREVWTWVMDPISTNFSRTVQDVILSSSPTSSSSTAPLSRATVVDRLSRSSLPPLIRISQLPEESYSGRVGREDAARVFFSPLKPCLDLTLEQYARLSGHRIDATQEDRKLFMWLFLPTAPGEAVRATWRNILRNINRWLED